MDLLKHNQDTLNELLIKLSSYDKVGVVQCTGSGKGCIAENLITDTYKDKKILLLAPQSAILMNYLLSLGIKSNNRIQLTTYQGICRCSNDELERLGKYADILILDEYHRVGADKWGRAVKILMDTIISHQGKVIGFTATPKRYLDNERDMTEELFNGTVVEGIDLTNAIKKGILPTFVYIKARYGYIDNIEEYRKMVKLSKVKELINPERIALVADVDKNINKIVSKEIQNIKGCQKWIVFLSRIEDLVEVEGHIQKWFNNPVTLFKMHSKQSLNENNKNLLNFSNSKKGINILLTVNKLNEGVHIKGISGVFMLRQTVSPIIFLQQLGRALSVNSEMNPIIFDFVNNVKLIQKYEDLIMYDLQVLANEVNEYMERRAKKNLKKGGKIILKSYCEDVDKVLEDIANVVGRRWSEEEDNILKEYYKEEKEDIVERLPGRNWKSIYQRARNLGLVDERNRWSRVEDNIIRKYYPIENIGVSVRLAKYTKRTDLAIKTRASQLGVKKDLKRGWTDEEDDLLKRKYKNGKYDIQTIHRLLNGKFTTEQIYQRLKYLNINVASTARWTSDEDGYLTLVWGNVSIDEIERKLIRHTRDAIIREASYLGLEKQEPKKKKGSNIGDGWSEKDIESLIELYNQYGKDCIPLFEPRSVRAVEQEITKLKKDLRYKNRFIR